jgi:hypothetical protein
VSQTDPNHVYILEVYDNEEVQKAHTETDHFKKYKAATAGMTHQSQGRAAVVGSNESERDVKRSTAAKKRGAVGAVGRGITGSALGENLLASGWRVAGYDVAADHRRALGRKGVEIAKNAGKVARHAFRNGPAINEAATEVWRKQRPTVLEIPISPLVRPLI